jgi:protein-arginine kinase|tara:strand:+ start:788 stop:1321 length:534 start_codon:yes stop_codon:yes gene_type:complete
MTDKKDDKPNLKLVSDNNSRNSKTKKSNVVGGDLTDQMRGFCFDVVGKNGEKGLSLIEAYRNNYNVSKDIKPNTLRMLASRLRAKDNIRIFIDHLLEQKMSLHRMNEVKRSDVLLEKIEKMADDVNITDSVRLKALEMLGKNMGLFTDIIKVDDKRDRTASEIETDLLTKLNSIISK